MKKIYIAPELEINESVEIVTTSSEVETESVPFFNTAPTGVSYGADGMFNI